MFFIVLDLINSYFQLRIAEESQPLLAFVCPFGKFVMRRVPQGWLAAGDHLNIETRIILQEIDRCAKIIDDTLLMPRTANEAYLMGSKICINAISRNFKFSQTKFKVAPVVQFAGLLLKAQPTGTVLIGPDPSRISDLLDLRSPTSKEELLSLLGLLATLNKWVPNLSVDNEPLHHLLRKNTHFSWAPDQETAMTKIKEAVKKHVYLSPFVPDLESFVFTDASTVGLGYILVQKSNLKGEVLWSIISCGSCSLTAAQS